MLERDVDRCLVRRAKQRGIVVVKLGSHHTRGWPDRVLLGPRRRFAFVEVKAKGGRLSAHQTRMIRAIQDSGLPVTVLVGGDTPAETVRIVDEFLLAYMEAEG